MYMHIYIRSFNLDCMGLGFCGIHNFCLVAVSGCTVVLVCGICLVPEMCTVTSCGRIWSSKLVWGRRLFLAIIGRDSARYPRLNERHWIEEEVMRLGSIRSRGMDGASDCSGV